MKRRCYECGRNIEVKLDGNFIDHPVDRKVISQRVCDGSGHPSEFLKQLSRGVNLPQLSLARATRLVHANT